MAGCQMTITSRVATMVIAVVPVAGLPVFGAEPPTMARAQIHHELSVSLDPHAHRIEVEDLLTLPASWLQPRDGNPPADIRFVLHGGLSVASGATSGGLIELLDGPVDRARFGINEDQPGPSSVPLREYRLQPVSSTNEQSAATVRIVYSGQIYHPLVSEAEEYARSFSRTPGLIAEEGVVLSGSSFWLPSFGEALVSFRLSVTLPSSWDAVSQGRRLEHQVAGAHRTVTWDSPEPMDEVYLIAAEFSEYARRAGDVSAQVYLRAPDPSLAGKYLEATVQYIEMYERLIGPYPYAKFALVENFWDTGYGMPSFTLLGPRIIRFPFILHSSYPHEILHNWWGNSVFVDYPSGNWCEGLTAYLADHLIKEGQAAGAGYRRDALNKYRSYVRGERDFPLTEFRSRHSSATEAVGYGKSMMMWHMLRRRVGDESFAGGLRRFYRDHRFERASFADLEQAFSAAAGADLGPFFAQWTERTGAPALRLGAVTSTPAEKGGATLKLEVQQTQPEEPYRIEVPIAVSVRGEDVARLALLPLEARSATLELTLPAPPTRVDVDPEFDLFRRVDPLEIPPSLAQLFGAERVSLVLPQEDREVPPEAWRVMAETWAESGAGTVEIVGEAELDALPADRAVWVLGSENRWSRSVRDIAAPLDAGVDDQTVRLGSTQVPRKESSFVFVVRHPADPELAIGWIGADLAEALPGLARKLPHYGKYSYLAFSGDEPTNTAKGQWPALDSPMVWRADAGVGELAALPPREPLAKRAPVFESVRLEQRVGMLSSASFEGRGVGTAGLDRAAELIADLFERAGLEPGGDDGSYFQSWDEPDGPFGAPVTLRNVIGVIPGTSGEWSGQSVVLGAHYDHLGRGWPSVRQQEKGKIHPGADDNASGVAVLLELADVLGRDLKPPRSIVFVAFSAEEWDLRGSRHYVEAMDKWPVSEAIAMINLDTVGRLHGQKIKVFGTASASEWPHIVRGIGFTTGVQAESVADDLGGSDQKSFHEAGVPAVQIFSGGHEDYHRSSDTADKIDAEGLVDVATFVREALVYLSERERPLSSALTGSDVAAAGTGPAASGERRVSLGTLPDFTFAGPGVKIERVMPDTPAAKAGLAAGDLILAIDGQQIGDVRAYSEVLKSKQPGQTIRIQLSRKGELLTLEATLVAR
ncbi:MAG: M20/M25/M40 family metallo-hydrolase [Acidobacteriota bacterium]|nr:MAG: M20/M25/M40 family metallo-hydrolase [Acidobacteriota bacterium]